MQTETDTATTIPELAQLSKHEILRLLSEALDYSVPAHIVEAVQAANPVSAEYAERLALTAVADAALMVDDLLVEHPHVNRAALMRVAGDALIKAGALLIRGAKELEGDVLDPAKFALVAFHNARVCASIPHQGDIQALWNEPPGTLRKMLTDEGIIKAKNSGDAP